MKASDLPAAPRPLTAADFEARVAQHNAWMAKQQMVAPLAESVFAAVAAYQRRYNLQVRRVQVSDDIWSLIVRYHGGNCEQVEPVTVWGYPVERIGHDSCRSVFILVGADGSTFIQGFTTGAS